MNSIMFKFAVDHQNLFNGSIESATKLAGHDLKGLVNFLNCGYHGIDFPMMTVSNERTE